MLSFGRVVYFLNFYLFILLTRGLYFSNAERNFQRLFIKAVLYIHKKSTNQYPSSVINIQVQINILHSFGASLVYIQCHV